MTKSDLLKLAALPLAEWPEADRQEVTRRYAEDVLGWRAVVAPSGEKWWNDGKHATSRTTGIWSFSPLTSHDDARMGMPIIKTWIFSKRLAFKKAYQRIVSAHTVTPQVLHESELVLYEEPRDIVLAVLMAKEE